MSVEVKLNGHEESTDTSSTVHLPPSLTTSRYSDVDSAFPADLLSPSDMCNEAFPSVEDLSLRSTQIAELIEARDHTGVETFLKERGVRVTIEKKKGCSAIHYDKCNVANMANEHGDSPLIMAAKVDSKMVEIVLNYGGNPNHTNSERDSPLSIAALRFDRDSITRLLSAGANLTAAVLKLTSFLQYQTKIHGDRSDAEFEYGFSVKPLTFLLSKNVYLKCPDPFQAAFDVSRCISDIVGIREEFRMEFELLIEDADMFTYKMLDHCEKMWEAREVLHESYGLIRSATNHKKKRFVAHPYSQQIIREQFYGEVSYKLTLGKLPLILRYIMSPVIIPVFIILFLTVEKKKNIDLLNSSLAKHMKLLFTPFMCFVTDIMNYLSLLMLLIVTCLIDRDKIQPHPVEWVLWLCVVSRVVIELEQVYQLRFKYIKYISNILETICCLIIGAAMVLRIEFMVSSKDEGLVTDENRKNLLDMILTTTYLYAIAEFLMMIRAFSFIEFFPTIGPLMIAIRHLVVDVFKFVMIFIMTCVVGSAISVHAIVKNIQHNAVVMKFDNPSLTCTGEDDLHCIPKYFQNFPLCVINVFWSTFGLLDMPDIHFGSQQGTSLAVVQIILCLYIILACVLLLNMLIAMLNNTFERIQDNCDIEWKYARSELLKEYRNGQPFFCLFHLFLFPITIWFRRLLGNAQRTARSTIRKMREKGLNQRDELLFELCERYELAMDKCVDMDEYTSFGERKTFQAVTALQRHKSMMGLDQSKPGKHIRNSRVRVYRSSSMM